MRRRSNPHFLEILAAAPWWVGAVAGLLVLLIGRVIAPALLSGSTNQVLAVIGDQLARGALDLVVWVFAGACWIAALVSFLGQAKRRRRLEEQSSLATLRAMSWREFEQLVSEAYRRLGYQVEETGQGGADGGVDLLLRRDGLVTLVQCKQWRTQRVGVPTVREQFGLLTHHQADAAIIVTVGDFTPEARAFAAGKPIDLIAGPDLLALVQCVQREPKPMAAAPPVAIEPARSAPDCPKCGASMVRRTARKTGEAFFGCSKYPACRGTRPIAGVVS